MEGFTHFPRDAFNRHIDAFYPLAVSLLERDVGSSEVRAALCGIFRRAGELRFGMKEAETPVVTPAQTPTSAMSPGPNRGFDFHNSNMSKRRESGVSFRTG